MKLKYIIYGVFLTFVFAIYILGWYIFIFANGFHERYFSCYIIRVPVDGIIFAIWVTVNFFIIMLGIILFIRKYGDIEL